ncbi:MAG TPA: POTRA domain-containing protein, partial [Candidatus Binataceae bacterium]|nr:POTRA domain-containing protein [Candidatus Binataceae bacterium]
MQSSGIKAYPGRIFSALLLFVGLWLASTCSALTVEDLDPAAHLKVGAITFKGNRIIADDTLAGVMKTKPRPFYLPWKPRPDFEPETFKKDLERLHIFYETQGYYHAQLSYNLTSEKKGKDTVVNAVLQVVEGQPIKIENINVNIDGYHPPRNTAPLTKLPMHPGEVFNQHAYQSGEQILRLFFVNAGYARARGQRRAQVDVVRNTARIFYTIHIGSKAYFGKTRLHGNKKVAAKIITRELAYKEGEEYSNKLVDDSRTNLVNLHLFSVVNLTPDLDSDAREIPVDLGVREGPKHDINISGGYSTQDDFGGLLQWNDYNWLGDGRQANLSLRYADINSYASASVRQPYLFDDRDLEGAITAVLREEDEQTFTLQAESVTPLVKYHFTEQLTGSLGYQLMYAQLSSVNISVIRALGGFHRKGIVSGPTASLVFDNTDDKYYPTRGSIVNLTAEQGGVVWGGDYKYYRATLEDRNYTTIA